MSHNISVGGVPVIIVGRGSEVMKNVVNAIKPEYDTVHTCLEVATAIDELPIVLSGSRDVLPASDIGTNISRKAGEPRPFPKAILIGGGVSQAEYEQVVEAVKGKLGQEAPGGVQWLKATREMYPSDLPPGEPPIDLIIGVAKKLFGTIA